MEFPREIKEYILSYLPHPYKTPLHLGAINKTPMFADMTLDREMTLWMQEEIDCDDVTWMDSYIEYRKMRLALIRDVEGLRRGTSHRHL